MSLQSAELDYDAIHSGRAVEFKGETIYLDYDPVHSNEDYYFATGKDTWGIEYEIRWEIINEECEEEDQACDWDEYTVKEI